MVKRVVLMLCASAWLLPAAAEQRSFAVVNEGRVGVAEVYASPDFREEWGAGHLGDDMIRAGAVYQVFFEGFGDHCIYDIRLIGADGTETIHRGTDLCVESEVQVVFGRELTFAVVNRSDWPVYLVYVSPADDGDWGDDRLGRRVIQTGSEADVLVADDDGQCLFDVRVIAEDSEEEVVAQEYLATNLCETERLFFGSSFRSRVFTVVNESDWVIGVVQASPTGDQEWGPERLGPDRVIGSGEQHVVELPEYGDVCVFDVRILARDSAGRQDGHTRTYAATNLCEMDRIVFDSRAPSSVLTVVNQSDEVIYFVFATLDSESDWGEERLGDDVILMGAEKTVDIGPVDHCVFDIRVVGAVDLEQVYDDHDICQDSRIVVQQEVKPEVSSFAVGDVFRDCQDWNCPWMVAIEPGSYRRGSNDGKDDEVPISTVTIRYPFAVGEYEVTVAQFRGFVRDTNRSIGNDCYVRRIRSWTEVNGADWGNPGFTQTDTHPVVCITWDDALAYAEWVGQRTGQPYRLLSEAEWEYLAIKSENRVSGKSGWANCARCGSRWGRKGTSPVGSFPADVVGLHDIFGNVWEWVQDCYEREYSKAPRDGRAWDHAGCARRVLRGGSWYTEGRYLRAALRNRSNPDNRHSTVGFRVARDLASLAEVR